MFFSPVSGLHNFEPQMKDSLVFNAKHRENKRINLVNFIGVPHQDLFSSRDVESVGNIKGSRK